MSDRKKPADDDRRALTVREQLAAHALTGLLAKPDVSEAPELIERFADAATRQRYQRRQAQALARSAVVYADALIDALSG